MYVHLQGINYTNWRIQRQNLVVLQETYHDPTNIVALHAEALQYLTFTIRDISYVVQQR